MTQRQTHLPPKTYTTYAELADYARARARISAARRGHQEFAYWSKVVEWAAEGARLDQAQREGARIDMDIRKTFERLHAILTMKEAWNPRHCCLTSYVNVVGDFYWQAVHLRRMLVNRGEKPPRLSLKWLRETAKKL